jgi:acetoin:2,6-dichlorophenolindophenol oxidoreductase subunit alpha
MQIPLETAISLYRTMLVSRGFDERCAELLARGEPVPHFHSGVGQEALMVGAVAPLRPDDQILYTHRGYGHLLAKGVPLHEIALDTFMKSGGTNEGFGGVMHVNRLDLGVPGREGVFGTRFGIAAGLALACQRRALDQVVVCFYGEAAGARGALYEAMNMAVLWRLPLVFVAENNGWSFSSRTEWLFPEGRMSRVWRGFEIPVEVIDGNDLEAVYGEISTAVERARSGQGPSVVEGLTYRVDPHIWWDDAAYQPTPEIEQWRASDPVARTRERLLATGASVERVAATERDAEEVVADAFARVAAAVDADWPTASLHR